jgi:hypothetical protein
LTPKELLLGGAFAAIAFTREPLPDDRAWYRSKNLISFPLRNFLGNPA